MLSSNLKLPTILDFTDLFPVSPAMLGLLQDSPEYEQRKKTPFAPPKVSMSPSISTEHLGLTFNR